MTKSHIAVKVLDKNETEKKFLFLSVKAFNIRIMSLYISLISPFRSKRVMCSFQFKTISCVYSTYIDSIASDTLISSSSFSPNTKSSNTSIENILPPTPVQQE